MEIPRLTSFVLLGCVAPVVAQMQPGAMLVEARVQSGTAVAIAPAAGAEVWNGLWRSVAGSGGSAAFGIVNAIDVVAAGATWQLSCAAWNGGPGEALGDVLYRFDSPVPQVGALQVDWTSTASGTGAVTLTVDVGDDGVIEASGATAIAVTFGPAPLLVRVRAVASAQAGTMNGPWGTSWSWNGSVSAQLAVHLVATHAVVTEVAAATCTPAPAMLARPDLWQGVSFAVTCPDGADMALLALGFDTANVPLPLSAGCTLVVAPAVVAAAPLWSGEAAFALAVPPALRPVALLAQPIAFDVDAGAGVATLTAGAAFSIDVQ